MGERVARELGPVTRPGGAARLAVAVAEISAKASATQLRRAADHARPRLTTRPRPWLARSHTTRRQSDMTAGGLGKVSPLWSSRR